MVAGRWGWLGVVAGGVILSLGARADEPRREGRALAGGPSPAGPHVAKIQALGDNAWLNLGRPAADPKWGTARGRSWSSNQPAAPNLRGGFVFAEGVHGYTKPDGRYMNDLWFYDINAHRWVCLYPGIEVKTVARRIRDRELTLNGDGLLVDRAGEPLPPLLIHAYGNLGYDPEGKKFLTFGKQFGNYFTWGEKAAFHDAYKLFQEQRQGRKWPAHGPFFFDTATGKFECFPVAGGPDGGGNFGADNLVYVPSKRQFFWGGTHGVWFLDPGRKAWTDARPKGTPPEGIDHCAAYDVRRDRIYYYQRDGKTAGDNFLVYGVKTNAWSKPRPQGPGPLACTAYETIFNYDAANDRLVAIRLYDGEGERKGEPGLRRGVYAYDPEANAWEEPRPLPAEVVKGIKNGNFGFYDPELNAYFCYFAGDSDDNGSMWVYRYKRRG